MSDRPAAASRPSACSGTLEDKLDAAAAGGLRRHRGLRARPIAAPWSPGEVAARLRRPRPDRRPLPAVSRLRGCPPDTLAREPAPRRGEVRGHGSSSAPTPCWSAPTVAEDAVDDDDAGRRAAAPARRARWRARAAHRLRGAGLGAPRLEVRPQLAHRRARRSPALGVCLDSFHILSRGTDLATIADIPARRSSSCSWPTPRGCGWTSCSGAATTAASPARAASTSPLPGPGPAGGVPRAALARGVQRRLPPGRPRPHGDRRDALAAAAGGGHPRADRRAPARSPALDVSGALPAAPRCAATPSRSSPWTRRSSTRTEGLLAALGFSAAGPPPLQAGHALARRHGQRAGQRLQRRRPAHRGDRGRDARIPPARRDGPERCWPRSSARERGPVEADLAAVAAPDGTAVFFCRSDAADAESWLADFAALPAEAVNGAAMVTGIDHLALSQPFDFFDEAALFYRAILGLELHDNRELAVARRARAQSRGEQPRRQVRLALNVPLLAGGETARAPAHRAGHRTPSARRDCCAARASRC